MAERKKSEVVLLRLSIKSDNPNTDTAMLLDDIEAGKTELEKALSRYPIGRLSMKRRGNYPIGMETAIITVFTTIGVEAGKAVIKKAAEDIYQWIRNRCGQGSVRKLPHSANANKSKKGKRPSKS